MYELVMPIHHTQEQINRCWADVIAGKYKDRPLNAPEIVGDDQVEQVIAIPVDGVSDHPCYSRKPGGVWEHTSTSLPDLPAALGEVELEIRRAN